MASTDATAADQNTQDQDIAAGLSQCMTRAGLAPATANQNFGGFKANALGAGVAATDATTLGQVQALIAAAALALIPPGAMVAFGGIAAPAGWLICDGTSYATATYPGLFGQLGYAYGGAGANFNVPDYVGRAVAGLDAGASRLAFATTLGATGGAQSVTLDATQIPAHTHSFSGTTGTESAQHTHALPAGSFGVIGNGGATNIGSGASTINSTANTAVESATHTHTVSGTTGNGTGGGLSHPNVQPTGVALWCIKT